MSTCESTRGEWGGRCPDCGEPLPPRPAPLTSWHADRNIDHSQARPVAPQTFVRRRRKVA